MAHGALWGLEEQFVSAPPDSIANFLKMQINRSHNINLGFPYFLCVWVLGLFFCLVGGFCLFVFSVGK